MELTIDEKKIVKKVLNKMCDSKTLSVFEELKNV